MCRKGIEKLSLNQLIFSEFISVNHIVYSQIMQSPNTATFQ